MLLIVSTRSQAFDAYAKTYGPHQGLPPVQLTACNFINLLNLTTYKFADIFLSVSEPSPLPIPCMSTPVTPSYQNIAATVRHVKDYQNLTSFSSSPHLK